MTFHDDLFFFIFVSPAIISIIPEILSFIVVVVVVNLYIFITRKKNIIVNFFSRFCF